MRIDSKLLSTGVLGLLLGLANAGATTVTVTSPATTSSQPDVLVDNFDSTDQVSYVGGTVYSSSNSSATQPTGGTGNFLSTGIGSVTFTPTSSFNYFGLLWSTVDTYNTITFSLKGGGTESFNPTTLDSAYNLGLKTDGTTTYYVNFFDGSTPWSAVTLSSTQLAFEVDNLAFGTTSGIPNTATPEPASMIPMGLGLGLLGFGAYRRKLAKN